MKFAAKNKERNKSTNRTTLYSGNVMQNFSNTRGQINFIKSSLADVRSGLQLAGR